MGAMRNVMLVGFVGLSGLAWGGDDHGGGDEHRVMLAFDSMYGVDGPFVDYEIRGIPGDELPWRIDRARGWLTVDGHLFLIVRGLVFTDDPEVPPELRGINDEENFRAVVSCISESEDETRVVRRNVYSRPFPANEEGDAFVWTQLDLPDACVAPVVFVLSGEENKWFAVTGGEVEEEEE